MPTWASSRSIGPRSSRRVSIAHVFQFGCPHRRCLQLTGVNGIARLFNSSPIQPRKCRILLTKIALLLYTGEKFPTNEATTLFFGISKLFQNKDASLRQMVHLVIKELANSAEDIIMVTSTIMKDTGGSTDAIYRPNAIRALCRIIDVS
jgi:coatomer subunit gamma